MSTKSSIFLAASRREYNTKLFSRDLFIELIKDHLLEAFLGEDRPVNYLEKCKYIEELVEEHLLNPEGSRLTSSVPTISLFHTPLKFAEAFQFIDCEHNISKRTHIPPSFQEIKDTLNFAQALSTGRSLALATFDGDGTLYNDGENFGEYLEIGKHIVELMRAGVIISVVTAAGYGLDAPKYEVRLQKLLDMFVEAGLSEQVASQFYVMGGECNYLLQCKYIIDPHDSTKMLAKLAPVPYELWQAEELGGPRPYYWPEERIKQVLDCAYSVISTVNKDFNLKATIIRKPRSVGVFSSGPKSLVKETLNEIVFRTKAELSASVPDAVPYCVFNGGHDCWVDIGNKAIGITALQKFLKVEPAQCLHFGDQFLRQGNDIAARNSCPTIWVGSPIDTTNILRCLVEKFV